MTPELWVPVLGPDVTAVSAITRLGGAEEVLVPEWHTWTNTFHLYWSLLRVSEDWACILPMLKPHILPQCNLVTDLGLDSVFQVGKQPTVKSNHLLTFQHGHYPLLRTSRWRFKYKKYAPKVLSQFTVLCWAVFTAIQHCAAYEQTFKIKFGLELANWQEPVQCLLHRLF